MCFFDDYNNSNLFFGLEYTDDKRDDFYGVMYFVTFVDLTSVIGMIDHSDFSYNLDGAYVHAIDYALRTWECYLGLRPQGHQLHLARPAQIQTSIFRLARITGNH